jgi:hypothetical protein
MILPFLEESRSVLRVYGQTNVALMLSRRSDSVTDSVLLQLRVERNTNDVVDVRSFSALDVVAEINKVETKTSLKVGILDVLSWQFKGFLYVTLLKEHEES